MKKLNWFILLFLASTLTLASSYPVLNGRKSNATFLAGPVAPSPSAAPAFRAINMADFPVHVTARYSSNNGQSIANGGSGTVINFEDSDRDTHTAVATGASWAFTAPVGGEYLVVASIMLSSGGGWAVGEQAYLGFRKGGALFAVHDYTPAVATHSAFVYLQGTETVWLDAGNTLDFVAYQDSGASITLHNDGQYNRVSIQWIGN